jgi:hypothetical protein
MIFQSTGARHGAGFGTGGSPLQGLDGERLNVVKTNFLPSPRRSSSSISLCRSGSPSRRNDAFILSFDIFCVII